MLICKRTVSDEATMRFYGRKEELLTLRSFLDTVREKNTSQLVAVLGRRRVGKTALILKAFEKEKANTPVFYFFAEHHAKEEDLVSAWLSEICRAYKVEFAPAIKTVAQLIDFLMTLSRDKECVCLIDECQNLGDPSSPIWSQLQRVWDLKKKKSRLLLVMTGSVMTLMENIFANSSEPLYARASGLIRVKAFSPKMVREIVLSENPKATARDLLTIYAITGGVAQYLELLAESNSLTAKGALDYLFSMRGAWLRFEGEIYLSNEFRAEAPVYIEILRAIASGATKWNEITDRVQSATQIAPYLNRLERFRIIERIQPIFAAPSQRRITRYAIRDQYFLFWLTFIVPEKFARLAETNNWTTLRRSVEKELPEFLGKALERWFLASYRANPNWETVGQWWDKKGLNEIDLVALNSEKKLLEVSEVKLNSEKYPQALLKKKIETFLEQNSGLRNYTLRLKGLSLENM